MKALYFANYEVDTDAKSAGVEYITNPTDIVATLQEKVKNGQILYFVDMDKDNELIKMNNWAIDCNRAYHEEKRTPMFRHMVHRLLEGIEETESTPGPIVGFIRSRGMCVVFTDDIRKCDKFNEMDVEFKVQTVVLPLDKFDHYFKIIKENESIFNPYFFIISDKDYLSHVDAYPRKTWCDEEVMVVLCMGVPCYNIPEEVDDCIKDNVKWDDF